MTDLLTLFLGIEQEKTYWSGLWQDTHFSFYSVEVGSLRETYGSGTTLFSVSIPLTRVWKYLVNLIRCFQFSDIVVIVTLSNQAGVWDTCPWEQRWQITFESWSRRARSRRHWLLYDCLFRNMPASNRRYTWNICTRHSVKSPLYVINDNRLVGVQSGG